MSSQSGCWNLPEHIRCKGRFRFVLKTFSFISGGQLVFVPAVSDAKKDMSDREILSSGEILPVFWNLLESRTSVCSETFDPK